MMSLILQLNGDLPERFEGHERRLYIFACKNKPCRRKTGTVRALRGTKLEKKSPSREILSGGDGKSNVNAQKTEQPNGNLGNSIFAPDGPPTNQRKNPFSSSSTAPSNASLPVVTNPFASKPMSSPNHSNIPDIIEPPSQPPNTSPDLSTAFAAKARISATATTPSPIPKEPWPTVKSRFPNHWPRYHLDADYEALEPSSPSSSPKGIPNNITQEDGIASDEKDAFESSLDKTFQRFADRLAQNPEQVLRYEFGGSPLLYSCEDAVGKMLDSAHPSTLQMSSGSRISTVRQQQGGSGIPSCANCGKARVFEMQLVPQAIAELEADEMGIDGMEWGTIIVGACSADCGERGVEVGEWGWVEEWVGVQWEEEGGRGGKV